jgi:hypothetical protein
MMLSWTSLVTSCSSLQDITTPSPNAEDGEVELHDVVCIIPIIAEAEMNLVAKTPAALSMLFVSVMATHDGLMEVNNHSEKAIDHLKCVVH